MHEAPYRDGTPCMKLPDEPWATGEFGATHRTTFYLHFYCLRLWFEYTTSLISLPFFHVYANASKAAYPGLSGNAAVISFGWTRRVCTEEYPTIAVRARANASTHPIVLATLPFKTSS
ncbi:hypothetical protein CERSUDRAFT_78615, partial [Gelatoporia subvermispora B]